MILRGEGGCHAVMRPFLFLKPFLGLETWFFCGTSYHYIFHGKNIFLEFGQFGGCSRTSSSRIGGNYRGHLKANLNLPGGRWRLILEARQVQIQMSYSNMPSCMTKCRFLKVRISFLTSKIISGYLEAAGGWSWRPARYRYDQTLIYAFMYV